MDNSDPSSPALVPQPHGGALLAGGIPGHRGAGGRPPSALREVMRLSLEKRIPVLEQLADNAEVAPRDRIKALEVLARFGVGSASEVETTHRFDTPPMTPDAARQALEERLARYKQLNEPNPLPAPRPISATVTAVDADFTIEDTDER